MGLRYNPFTAQVDYVGIQSSTSSTDNAIVRYDGTTGQFVQTSVMTLGDTGIITGATWQANTIDILYGGTGQTTASGAINALVPSQTANAGKVLSTNGTVVSWQSDAGITSLTGDVTASGSGSVVATISVGAVTDTKASLANKPAITVVATTNQALTGVPTIDGQLTVAGTSIVLLTAQSTGAQNGPWIVQSGAWTRPTWYPTGGTTQAFQFITTLARLGTTYQGTTWRMTTAGAITIDTTATTWSVTPLAINPSTTTGLTFATTTKTANYTVTSQDSLIFCDTNSVGAFNLQLPDPTTVTGKVYRIIDSKGTFNTNNLTLVRFGSELISGLAASRALQANWGFYQLVSNGTDWVLG